MSSPTIRVLLTEDVASDAELEVRELKRAGLRLTHRIVDSDRLRLVVPVPEAYTASLSNHAALTFTVAAYPGHVFSGTISRIRARLTIAERWMRVKRAESRRRSSSLSERATR